MEVTHSRTTRTRTSRYVVVTTLAALAIVASACGSRLTGSQAAEARGASTGTGHANTAADGSSNGGGTEASNATTTTVAGGATGTTVPGGSTGTGSTGGGATATGGGAATTGTGASGAASGPCGPNGTSAPSGGNGGATATGVTATTITVGDIASLSGVAPGLTQSAQQATEAWAAYVNSQGGICGRMIKVQPFDDGNDSGTNYADASQACASDFAMVGNASGFDDGSAQAVNSCSIPTMAAEVSTLAAGNTPDIFGASPGDGHNFELGPAEYLKATYPNAVQHAAMIYLNVPATAYNAMHEVSAYESVGFKYVYDTSTTPTNANYAANVQAMQSAGVQYVTEYSDASSAERLLQSMQQANFAPQVVDWFSEEYSPQFAQQTQPESNGDLVLMSATDAYEDASSNPQMQLFLSWLNRVAPGAHRDIFGILAWSAGLAFEQAAKAVGPDLTRPAVLAQLKGITNWTGGGIQPAVNIGGKVPGKCFAYFKIENGAFQRVYPTAPNTFDCTGALFSY
jgi:ABC-type branched-subunit amino acid transport system substrate-binding protein